jgi:acyl-coenzyme A synthetase/AMP-(fatty) acid ligase
VKTRIDSAVAARARDTPHALAVASGSGTLSAVQLADWSGGIQRHLRRVPPGPVLVSVEDVRPFAASLIATAAEARCAVIVDPKRGRTHLETIGTLAKAAVLLHDSGVESGIGMLRMQAIDVCSVGSGSFRPGDQDSDAIVAMLPTSGSTGDPKFYTQTHRTYQHRASVLHDEYELTDSDVMMRAFTHTSSTLGLLSAALVLDVPFFGSDLRQTPPSALLRTAARLGVTYLHLSPTSLRQVLRASTTKHNSVRIRVAGGGGEPMSWADVRLVRAALGSQCAVTHQYALTEAGVVSLTTVPPGAPIESGLVSPGYPTADRLVWIDEGQGLPADHGVHGEIVVEGRLGTEGGRVEQLAAGRQKFRTRDVGWFDESGRLFLAGRLDRMEKISGARVDLQAIETTLREVDDIEDACATAYRTRDGLSHVIAFVVTRTPRGVEESELRVRCAVALPESHVPRRIVVRAEQFPVMSSGKIDLPALLKSID